MPGWYPKTGEWGNGKPRQTRLFVERCRSGEDQKGRRKILKIAKSREGKLSEELTKVADMTKGGWSTGFGFAQEQITRDKAKFPPRLSCTCTNCCLSLQIKVMSAVR